jgi:hypothetical protein
LTYREEPFTATWSGTYTIALQSQDAITSPDYRRCSSIDGTRRVEFGSNRSTKVTFVFQMHGRRTSPYFPELRNARSRGTVDSTVNFVFVPYTTQYGEPSNCQQSAPTDPPGPQVCGVRHFVSRSVAFQVFRQPGHYFAGVGSVDPPHTGGSLVGRGDTPIYLDAATNRITCDNLDGYAGDFAMFDRHSRQGLRYGYPIVKEVPLRQLLNHRIRTIRLQASDTYVDGGQNSHQVECYNGGDGRCTYTSSHQRTIKQHWSITLRRVK